MKLIDPVMRLLALALTAIHLAPAAKSESIYFIGNSVTDTVRYEGLQALAAARGHSQPWGRQMIPGAPLQWLWDHPSDGFTQAPYGYPSNALPNYVWDNLSLQPFDRPLTSDLDYSQRYISLLFGGDSPTSAQFSNRTATRILIYSRWPRQDPATYPGGPRDYDTLWLRNDSNVFESASFFRNLTTQLRQQTVSGVSLSDRVFLVPVGEVMYQLNQQMRAGQVPGYSNIFQLYTDGIHLNDVGAYLVACTFYAVIYRDNPTGLPVPSQYGSIPSNLVSRIQDTVWTVVQNEPLSGVGSAGALQFVTTALPNGLTNRSYSTTISAMGGNLPRSFSLVAGSLPPGMTLAPSGLLSGTPTTAGDFSITVRVTDSTSQTSERVYNLRIVANTQPAIQTPANLGTVRVGDRLHLPLVAQNGNAPLTWSLVSGSLPQGVVLGASGVLLGSVIQEGNFSFTVRVADADFPPDTDQRTFNLTVLPAGPETIFVPRTLSPVRVDGALTETHWSQPHTAGTVGVGAPDNQVRFGLLWDDDALHLSALVLDSQLSDGTGTGHDRDSIDVFIDAFHDKEAEFNSQHRQFRLSLNGSLQERGGRSSGVQHALVLVPGGYQIEMSIPWTNLGITPVPGQTVIGFDIANHDAEDSNGRIHHLRFAGVHPDDPRPSQFGNAILSLQTVSGTGGEPLSPSAEPPAVYEPFGGAQGLLHGSSGTSFGFSSAWEVEGSDSGNPSPGYSIIAGESLNYGRLATSGGRVTGGESYRTSGRALDVTSALSPWRITGQNLVGKSGETLWISYLVRPIVANAALKFSLDDGGAVFHDNNGVLRIEQQAGVWRLSLLNGTVLAPTSVTVSANTTYLMVVRLDFGTTTTARLYINPDINGDIPGSPSATATTSSPFRFNQLQLYPGSSSNQGQFDEIRMGPTWRSVVPIPADMVRPVQMTPLPGAYNVLPTVQLSTQTPDAVIRFTVDGSAPGPESPIYTAPIQLAGNTTIRAVAIRSDGTMSAPSGGIYNLAGGYQAWASSHDWQGLPSDPDEDVDGDGVSNFLEFALGGNPLTPNTAILPQLEIIPIDSNTRMLTLQYLRARAEVNYSVETSTDMQTWTTTGVQQDETTPVGQIASAHVIHNLTTDPARFLRLNVGSRQAP